MVGRYEEGEPIPPGYVVEKRIRRGPVVAGSIVFGTAYLLGLLVASADDYSNETGWLIVPVLGPWLTLATRNDGCSNDFSSQDYCSNDDDGVRTLLTLDGLTQATGAVLFIWGVASRTKWLVPQDQAFRLAPARLGSGYGLVTSGQF